MKSIERYKLEGHPFVVFVMCGIPGSGKSTWVQENHNDLPFVSRDVVRTKLGYTAEGEKAVLTNGQEAEVTREEYFQMAKLGMKKKSFCVDDTNGSKYRKELLTALRSYNAYIIGVNMDTPLEVCINRRRGQIPASKMEQIALKHRPLREDEVDELITVKGY
jgi:predicted kinase